MSNINHTPLSDYFTNVYLGAHAYIQVEMYSDNRYAKDYENQ